MILKRGNLSALFLLRFPGTKKAALSCGGGICIGVILWFYINWLYLQYDYAHGEARPIAAVFSR